MSDINSNIEANKLLDTVVMNQFDYLYLRTKVNAKFESTNGEKQSFTANIRMKKDSVIWALISKMNYPALNIIITPDSLKFINKVDKKYFLGDFDYINQMTQSDINFRDIQNILTGNPVAIDTAAKYYLIKSEDKKYISNLSEKQIEDLEKDNFSKKKWLFMYLVNSLYKVSETEIYNPNKNSTITIYQSDYKDAEGQMFPMQSDMTFVSEQDSVDIQLKYSRITNEESLTFPFVISSKYQPYE